MTEALVYGFIFGWVFMIIILGLIVDRSFSKKTIEKSIQIWYNNYSK